MAIPEFGSDGNLPEGVHIATIDEVVARFGTGTPQRQAVTVTLRHVYDLARATGKLERFFIYGSYVTGKPAPNDVDVFLIMAADFEQSDYIHPIREVFDHSAAHVSLAATIFWMNRSAGDVLIESSIFAWQITREKTRRGIVEVLSA